MLWIMNISQNKVTNSPQQFKYARHMFVSWPRYQPFFQYLRTACQFSSSAHPNFHSFHSKGVADFDSQTPKLLFSEPFHAYYIYILFSVLFFLRIIYWTITNSLLDSCTNHHKCEYYGPRIHPLPLAITHQSSITLFHIIPPINSIF